MLTSIASQSIGGSFVDTQGQKQPVKTIWNLEPTITTTWNLESIQPSTTWQQENINPSTIWQQENI